MPTGSASIHKVGLHVSYWDLRCKDTNRYKMALAYGIHYHIPVGMCEHARVQLNYISQTLQTDRNQPRTCIFAKISYKTLKCQSYKETIDISNYHSNKQKSTNLLPTISDKSAETLLFSPSLVQLLIFVNPPPLFPCCQSSRVMETKPDELQTLQNKNEWGERRITCF